MPRSIASGRELSFHKPSGRWCKTIAGQRLYFGSGKSPQDRASYRAAVKKYREYMDNRELAVVVAEASAEAAKHTMRRLMAGQKLATNQRTQRIAKGWIDDDQATEESDDANESLDDEEPRAPLRRGRDPLAWHQNQQRMQELARARQDGTLDALLQGRNPLEYLLDVSPRRGWHPRKSEAATDTIAALVQEYLRCQQQRVQMSEKVGHTKGRTLGDRGYAGMKNGLNSFIKFAGQQSWGDARQTEVILNGYRTHLEKQLTEGHYTVHTFNDKLKHLGPHLKWLYQQRKLEEMPRNMSEVCRKLPVTRAGEPLTREQVHSLWQAADERMRCWIALALNCGYYSKDISDLTPADLTRAPGYLARFRQKENVPSKHKLWPVTDMLIQRCRDDKLYPDSGRLFCTKNGSPLNTVQRDRVGSAFTKLAKSLNLPVTFSQLRDTGAQFVESVGRCSQPIDLALTQLYLAHRDDRTAAYYLSNDPQHLQTPGLDTALDEMDQHLGLQHLPTVATRRCRVRRDAKGHIVAIRPIERGRCPRGFTVEELPLDQCKTLA